MRTFSLPPNTPKATFELAEGYSVILLWNTFSEVYTVWIDGYVEGRAIHLGLDLLEGARAKHSLILTGDTDPNPDNISTCVWTIKEI